MSSAPVYVVPPLLTGPAAPASTEVTDLLRQLLAAQQEQVALLKAQAAASQDGSGRWKAFLARWADDFPGVGGACRQSMPALERAYLGLVAELTDKVVGDPDVLGDEFALAEFLDRYGMKLAQMGNILNQLAPLADAAGAPEKG